MDTCPIEALMNQVDCSKSLGSIEEKRIFAGQQYIFLTKITPSHDYRSSEGD